MTGVLSVWMPIIILVLMSGLFSGLTLGLLSLDIKQLELCISGGSEDEQKHAQRILPTRKHGNWLLCTLLLGNVAVNAMLSILLAEMTTGLMGFLLSTALIVIFGEILPQACCSRYGLCIGYYTVPLVWVFMAVLCPMAWPISFILDKALGDEEGQIYSRNMMKQLVHQHAAEPSADFEQGETDMMCHVLEMQEKAAMELLKPLEDVFCVEYDSKLDFEALAQIMECGHSRIPVYRKDKAVEIPGLLYVKDLILLNPDDEFRVKDIMEYYNHQPLRMDCENMKCGELLSKILEGNCHMVLNKTAVEDPQGEKDTVYRYTGIITLEDLIAVVIGKHEPAEPAGRNTDVTPTSRDSEQRQFIDMFRRKKAYNKLSPNEITMIYQILLAKVPAFQTSNIDKQSVVKLLKAEKIQELPAGEFLYQLGHVIDQFTLLLEGHVEIVCGSDKLIIEVGPWTPIGTKALSMHHFQPDFTARAREGGASIKFLQISTAVFEKYRSETNTDSPQPMQEPPESKQLPPDTVVNAMESKTVRSRNSSRSRAGLEARGLSQTSMSSASASAASLPGIETELNSIGPKDDTITPGEDGH